MKVFLTAFLFVAYFFDLNFATFGKRHTSFEKGDYTFNGRVICDTASSRIGDNAYAEIWENDPLTPDDFVNAGKIYLNGSFTIQTVKEMMDPPTHKWELYLLFHDPCYPDDEDALYSSEFLKPDTTNSGYTVNYTIKHDLANGNYVDVSA
uniref:Uncharacterized protein n=1 Tax=Panagrolaimus superbus TaxID=310955 RepID=A0A914YZC8_9BILA